LSNYIHSIIFSLTAGFKSGPLGIVVIQQTLEHGLRSRLKACLALIISDGPIIIAAVLVLTQCSDKTSFIGILSLVGGLYLLWLSLKIFSIKQINILKEFSKPKSLKIAIKVNLLSPNTYLFWFMVGGTYLTYGTESQSEASIFVSVGIFGSIENDFCIFSGAAG
jgi:threonine/homoserine/homoserine lactone efflux protein